MPSPTRMRRAPGRNTVIREKRNGIIAPVESQQIYPIDWSRHSREVLHRTSRSGGGCSDQRQRRTTKASVPRRVVRREVPAARAGPFRLPGAVNARLAFAFDQPVVAASRSNFTPLAFFAAFDYSAVLLRDLPTRTHQQFMTHPPSTPQHPRRPSISQELMK